MLASSSGSRDPERSPHEREVLAALGVEDRVADLASAEAEFLTGVARTVLLQAVELVDGPRGEAGWQHVDPRILDGQGAVSATLAPVLRERIVPRLDGLSSRLDGLGAAFLDIGVGVAKLSIAIAGTWPSPRVLGIDPFLPALTLGADHVAQAGLHDRVALRALRAEELDADQAFDLAWFSLPFVPDTVLERALSKVHAALRPGGWLLTATLAGPGELGMALARLRTSRFGGRVIASPRGRDSADEPRVRRRCHLPAHNVGPRDPDRRKTSDRIGASEAGRRNARGTLSTHSERDVRDRSAEGSAVEMGSPATQRRFNSWARRAAAVIGSSGWCAAVASSARVSPAAASRRWLRWAARSCNTTRYSALATSAPS